jgi:hypothetical protein
MVGCGRTLTDREVKLYSLLMPQALARREIDTPRLTGPESIAATVLTATGSSAKAAIAYELAKRETAPKEDHE